ncbi:thiamine pyrophosphate-binding protein [Saccharopolyspora sp. NPDC002376]
MADSVTGGQLLVQALRRRDVDRIFSVSGGPINAVYDACASGAPQLHHVRHEAAAGFMAEASYRVRRQPGVAVVTLGPGVTNTVTPCVSASLAGVPMLVVGGRAPRAVADKGAGMSTDTLSIMRGATKWAVEIRDIERIPEYVGEAWRRMTAPTPGPVYLEIGVDVLDARIDEIEAERLLRQYQPGASISSTAGSLDDVTNALADSSRTLVLVGDDCYRTSDGEAVSGFLDQCGGVFAPLRMARGLVPESDPRCIGPGYVPCNPVLSRALKEADVVVLLGHHWEFDLEFGAGIGAGTTVIQVDPDASRLGRNGRVDLAVVATADAFLDGIETKPAQPDSAWATGLREEWTAHRRRTSEQASASEGLHPVTLVESVAAAVPAGTTFVTSHGNIDFWADETLEIDGAGSYLRSGQSGTLGAEVPYGVSAALINRTPAVVFVGDGGIGYAVAELDTAARYDAPVLVVVADDEQWSAIALPQHRAFGGSVELGLPARDWAQVAEGLGAQARSARTPEEIRAAVRDLTSTRRPALLHVPIRAVESPYMKHISR